MILKLLLLSYEYAEFRLDAGNDAIGCWVGGGGQKALVEAGDDDVSTVSPKGVFLQKP